MTSKKAFLCVDDEKSVLDVLKEQLKKRFGDNYLYEIAESVDEAWEVIEELHEDGVVVLVIITDWLMPGTKGDEFLVELHARFPSIVAIMLTGQADQQAIQRAYKAGNLFRCLEKPWNEEELARTIEMAWTENA